MRSSRSATALPVLWREDRAIREMAVFPITAVDTLGAGDVFHGAFALALAAGRGIAAAMRFAAASAGLKCTRFGGSTGAPRRPEVEALLAQSEARFGGLTEGRPGM